MKVTQEIIATIDGKNVEKYSIINDNDIQVGVLTLGATFQEFLVPDGKGGHKNIIIGFDNPEDIPEENKKAAEWFINFLDDYDIQLADVDLETDMLNSSLQDSLKEYYDEDGEMSDREIIEEMKKHKALNMYNFLKKNKERLHLLKDDKLATMLIKAKEYIESHYGTYTHPA